MKKMKHLSGATLAFLSLCCLVPSVGTCYPPEASFNFKPFSTDFDPIIHDLLNQTEVCNTEAILFQMQNIANLLQQSNDLLIDSHTFLEKLVNTTNARFGTSISLHEVLRLASDFVCQLPISDYEMDQCFFGLNMIGQYANSLNQYPLGYVHLAGSKKSNAGFWTWLTVATVLVGTTTICIINPAACAAIAPGLGTYLGEIAKQK